MHLGPGNRRSFGAIRADCKGSFAVAAVKLMGQPRSGVFLPCMVFHVADNGVFAFDFTIPVLDSTINVIVRKRAQQLMELGIGLVDDFLMKALPELRGIGIEVKQLFVTGRQNSALDGRPTFDYGTFIVTVSAGVPVSGVLGNSLQYDGFVLLLQLSKGGLCRLWLMVGSFRLRLFLGKRKSRGCLHILCFIYSWDLFRFGEEQV